VEGVAVGGELLTQFAVVVDFAVEGDGGLAGGVGHGLVPIGREVYDGKAAVAKGDGGGDGLQGLQATAVWPAVGLCIGHLIQCGEQVGDVVLEGDDPSDTTHKLFLS
jgi:hypothetical protein